MLVYIEWSDNIWQDILGYAACDVKHCNLWNNDVLEQRRARMVLKKGPHIAHTVCVVNKEQLRIPEVTHQEQLAKQKKDLKFKQVSLKQWQAMHFNQFKRDDLVFCLGFCILILDLAWTKNDEPRIFNYFRKGFMETGTLETFESKILYY